MNSSTFGVQKIPRRSNADWSESHRAAGRRNSGGDHKSEAARERQSDQQATPPPGLGEIVDKTV